MYVPHPLSHKSFCFCSILQTVFAAHIPTALTLSHMMEMLSKLVVPLVDWKVQALVHVWQSLHHPVPQWSHRFRRRQVQAKGRLIRPVKALLRPQILQRALRLRRRHSRCLPQVPWIMYCRQVQYRLLPRVYQPPIQQAHQQVHLNSSVWIFRPKMRLL